MINHRQLQYTDDGRVKISPDSPTEFSNGTPTKEGGVLCFDLDTPNEYAAQLGYVDSKLAVRQTIPIIGDRLISVRAIAPIAVYWCGLPFTADGRLAVEGGVLPPFDEHGFSDGFDQGGFA